MLNGQAVHGLVDSRDPKAFADRVEGVVNGSYQVSQKDRERVTHDFSADRLEQDVRALYGQLLDT